MLDAVVVLQKSDSKREAGRLEHEHQCRTGENSRSCTSSRDSVPGTTEVGKWQ